MNKKDSKKTQNDDRIIFIDRLQDFHIPDGEVMKVNKEKKEKDHKK